MWRYFESKRVLLPTHFAWGFVDSDYGGELWVRFPVAHREDQVVCGHLRLTFSYHGKRSHILKDLAKSR